MAEKRELNTRLPASDDPASFVQVRPKLRGSIRQAPFAGRIGGNQEFIAIGDDEESEAILKKQPDAVWLHQTPNLGAVSLTKHE